MKIEKAETLNVQFRGEMDKKIKQVEGHNAELEKENSSLKEFKNLKK